MRRTTLADARFTEVMTEVRGSEKSALDKGEAADGRSNGPMYTAMEMATEVTSIATETAGEATVQPMDRNQNGKQGRRGEVLATAWALGDWKSHIERTAKPEARELAQLHGNRRKDATHAGVAPCTAGGAVARDEIVVGGNIDNAGHVQLG